MSLRCHPRGLALGLVLVLLSVVQGIARGAPESFANLAQRLLPTVVSISARETVQAANPEPQSEASGSKSLKGLLDKFSDKPPTPPKQVSVLGSGFIIDPSGLIVTNNHVIEGADTIAVTLDNGTILPAAVVGRDDKTDLALLRVRPASPLAAARFGDSDRARVGDWVVAIGNPFGLGSSVTAGIVSARNRDIAEGPYDDFIQTDAPINRGNSGGPLFDMDGNVMGVTSALYSPSGGSVGVGFAIPSDIVRGVVGQLREHGQVRRGWIGVRIQPVTKQIAESRDMAFAEGALVSEVTASSPAARAGLVNGDVITAINGESITDSRALPRLIADLRPGSTATVEALRAGRMLSFQVAIAMLDAVAGPAKNLEPGSSEKIRSGSPDLGLGLAPVDARLRAKYGLGDQAGGVVVTDIEPGSPAGESDFRPGDMVREVQDEAVSSPEQISDRLAAYARTGRRAVLFLVSRNGRTSYIALPLGGDN